MDKKQKVLPVVYIKVEAKPRFNRLRARTSALHQRPLTQAEFMDILLDSHEFVIANQYQINITTN